MLDMSTASNRQYVLANCMSDILAVICSMLTISNQRLILIIASQANNKQAK